MTNGSRDTDTTTMRLRRSTLARLEGRKVHPNQSLDEVINELMDLTETPKEVPA